LKFWFRVFPTPTFSLTTLCFHAQLPLSRWSESCRIWI
jgi:hypothetical protein